MLSAAGIVTNSVPSLRLQVPVFRSVRGRVLTLRGDRRRWPLRIAGCLGEPDSARMFDSAALVLCMQDMHVSSSLADLHAYNIFYLLQREHFNTSAPIASTTTYLVFEFATFLFASRALASSLSRFATRACIIRGQREVNFKARRVAVVILTCEGPTR